MTLTVGIDGRALSRRRSGIGRYVYEVLKEYASMDLEVIFHLYCSSDAELPPECLRSANFNIHIIHLPLSFIWYHCLLPFYAIMHKLDIFWGPNYAIPLFLPSQCRVVSTIHDLVALRYPETMLWRTRIHHQALLPLYAKRADTILTDSEFVRGEIIELLKVPESKAHTVYLGTRRMEYISKKPPLVEGAYVLAVGTIEPRKNLRSVIEAFSFLVETTDLDVKLLVVGGHGWGEEDLALWFAEYGVTGSASYLGAVSDSDLAWLYHHAVLLVFPSLYEGFGLPVVEAMSAGCPVVCSYTSSLAEVAAGRALLCDPLNVRDIAMKMQAILEDESLAKSLRNGGLQRVRGLLWQETSQAILRHLTGR